VRVCVTCFSLTQVLCGLSARTCILYAQWHATGSHSSDYVPAHYVVIDPRQRAVVLVVRGSAGLRDAFVNLHTVSFYLHLHRSNIDCAKLGV